MSNISVLPHTDEMLKINISVKNYFFIGYYFKHMTTEIFSECSQISKFSLTDTFIINLH